MIHQLCLIALTLVAFTGVTQAQTLSAKERAFGASIAAVSSKLVSAKKRTEPQAEHLDLQLEGGLRVLLIRYDTADRAFEAASQTAVNPAISNDPALLEQRGRDVLLFHGPGLIRAKAANRIRTAAWKAFPWASPTSQRGLLLLNLRERGTLLRVDRPEGSAYRQLKRTLDHSGGLMAPPGSPLATVSWVSATEAVLTHGENWSRLVVTPTYAVQVSRRGAAPAPLFELSTVAGVKLVGANGASNALADATD